MTAYKVPPMALAVAVTVALVCGLVPAQEAPSPQGKEIAQLWEDFLHYIRIARSDLAQSFGQAILDSGTEPQEIYLLSVQTRGTSAALSRGSRLDGMAVIIGQLRQMIERGHEALRQDPEQIANSIALLSGTVRGYEMGARRLSESGEYALPQLIQKLRDPGTPVTLRERITEVLPRLGKDAVRPLSVALQAKDSALLEVMASALARIEYPHASARLKELSQRPGLLARTKRAAENALLACGGESAMAKTTAALYYEQAVNYYYQKPSVAPDLRYSTANVWYWLEERGLTYRVVPREVFCDVYAMRMCRLALAHDANFYPAVSLWVAANLKRKADLPEGADDPTYGEQTPDPTYFALASSAKYLQHVLARGLRDGNSAVAKGAIAALAQTSGAKNLVTPISGGAQPLVEALGYADRHVRFLAAISLANALPDKRFNGYQSVVPQLVQAIRQTGQKTALMAIADQELANRVKDSIRAAGYEVIDKPDPSAAIAEAHRSAGVDVVVLATRPSPVEVINTLRQDSLLATLPVVMVGTTEAVKALAAKDLRIVQIETSADSQAIATGLAKASGLASGEKMTDQQAADWSVQAANAVEYLGATSNKVYDITRAAPALINAVNDQREEVRLASLAALAVMELADAQRAIATAAVDDSNDEGLRIEAFNNLSASLRRFGNQLTDELAEAVIQVVVGDGSSELLSAAAQALGAMDLPSEKVKSLILKTSN